MSRDAIPHTFIAESRELLRDVEGALLTLKQAPRDRDAVDALFRAAHTIKGSSGMFGFDAIVDFTHVLEGLMVDLREDLVPVDGEVIALLLECADHLASMVDCLDTEDRHERLAAVDAGSAPLLARLRVLSPASATALRQEHSAAGEASLWQVSVRFAPDVLRDGMDPLSLLRYLSTLGDVEEVQPLLDALPPAEGMDPETCYLALELRFRGSVQRRDLEEAFDYVREGSTISIAGPLGEGPAPAPTEPVPPGEHARAQPAAERRLAGDSRFVRVDASKLDDLVNLVGELVIASAGVSLGARRPGSVDLVEAAANLGRLVEEVRDGALALRMVPIGETFQRFHRVVHDLGQVLGKDVELVVSGAETELDKSMVQLLNDPLMHLVRNAMDHGIEPAAQRLENGKPPRGRLMLNAYHETGSIVIEVADDGGGLDRDRILARALQAGLVAPDHALAPQQIHELVMEPGFSTAEQVTSVSGRGIGMDVVRRNVESLRGSVTIHSEPGEGTVMALRVPLTLAIIDGFLVGVGSAAYVVPLETVVECLELPPEGRRDLGYLNLRGEVLPLLRLREVFEVQEEAGRRENIVVVQYGRHRAGFVVDTLMGEFQTVIKPLGKLFERLAGISGSTILGTGDVALILDVQALVDQAVATEAGRMAPTSAAHGEN